MPPIAEAMMSEPTQGSLFTIPADDHVRMIQTLRDQRERIRTAMLKHLEHRLEIARRMNAAEAEYDDLVDGIGRPRDPREAINLVTAAKQRRDKVRAEMRDALTRARDLKALLMRAQADVELSIGGVQRSLIEEIAHVEPEKHETAKSLRTARQRGAAEAAVRALRAMGGRATCVELASVLHLSAHGLGGLIDHDPRLRKTHDGRRNNLETVYELVDEAKR
jgi:hypothetical protein